MLRHAAELAPQAENPRYYIMRQSGCVRSEPRRENGKWWRHPWNAEHSSSCIRQGHSSPSARPSPPSHDCNCLRGPFPLTIFVYIYLWTSLYVLSDKSKTGGQERYGPAYNKFWMDRDVSPVGKAFVSTRMKRKPLNWYSAFTGLWAGRFEVQFPAGAIDFIFLKNSWPAVESKQPPIWW
jgi:hypothetical protein